MVDSSSGGRVKTELWLTVENSDGTVVNSIESMRFGAIGAMAPATAGHTGRSATGRFGMHARLGIDIDQSSHYIYI
jgi:hypothetical protein